MEEHFLTAKYYLKGSIMGAYERLFKKSPRPSDVNRVAGYKLVNLIKAQNDESWTSVGVFSSKKNKKAIIKTVEFGAKNLAYEQLLNEGNMLKLLSNLPGKKTVAFPKVLEFISNIASLHLVTELIDGTPLVKVSEKVKVVTIKGILEDFKNISKNIPSETLRKLPKRSSLQITLTFPVFLTLVTLRDFKNIKSYFSYLRSFLSLYANSSIFRTQYILAHKDLHSQNILIKGKKAYVIDPEICVLADPETDAAHSVRYFSEELPHKTLVELFGSFFDKPQEKKKFVALSIYYAIQMMAIRAKNDPDYIEAENFLKKHMESVAVDLGVINKTTFGEKIYFGGLNVLSFLNNLLKSKASEQPAILCYHSISNDSWRYSVNEDNFKKQIAYIKKMRDIVSLDQMLNEPNNTKNIAITFDDGYRDFMTDALPIMKKEGVVGTIFVLGASEEPNRETLANTKELMSIEDMRKIKSMGWEVGFHSSTHAKLSALSAAALKSEIIDGKKRLEKKLGFKLKYFAYPMGEYTDQVKEVVKKAGFEAAFSTDGGQVSDADKFTIDRICIEGRVDTRQFQTLISDLGLLFNSNFMRLLKLKSSFA
ncbi:MAG TPA: polysaccharide deacetylase family protein [Patescibacteria group bacterium]|nr:polysaccharide deacetylase family protein [Patescibacteria group bacterium]